MKRNLKLKLARKIGCKSSLFFISRKTQKEMFYFYLSLRFSISRILRVLCKPKPSRELLSNASQIRAQLRIEMSRATRLLLSSHAKLAQSINDKIITSKLGFWLSLFCCREFGPLLFGARFCRASKAAIGPTFAALRAKLASCKLQLFRRRAKRKSAKLSQEICAFVAAISSRVRRSAANLAR